MVGVQSAPVVSPVMVSSLVVWSGSVSLARTASVTATFLMVPSRSSFAIGASLTQFTTNEPVAVLESDPLASSVW